MKHFFYFLIIFVAGSVSGQGLYDAGHITEIRITFTQSDWDAILDEYYLANQDQRLLATVSVNGTLFDSCGVQFKGNSTYSPNNAKNPLNIKLDYIKKQNFQGWETLKLANGKNDPSFLREVVSYELLRNYTEAPLSNYARVYINDTYYGMFSSSESIDGDFQERYLYANDDNLRVKCNPLSVQGDGSSLKYYGDDSTKYYRYYEMKSDHGWGQLVDFCKNLAQNPADIESYLDIDRAIWMLAFNNVVVNLDSYTGPFRQNYYLVRDDSGRIKPVIWDLNMSFGAFSNISPGGGGGNALKNMQQLNPYLRENDSGWPLLKTILADPTYRRMYIAHCKTILEEQIESGLYAQRAQYFQDLIKADVELDKNSTYTYQNFLKNLTSSVTSGGGGGMGSFCGITELMNTRLTYLQSQAAFMAAPPDVADIEYPQTVASESAFVITAKIENASQVLIAYRNKASGIFIKQQLFDDGANGDATAGDGIYTCQFAGGIDRGIQFYIYAENEEAGIFYPARAEHEYYTVGISISSEGLVINEFMASNASTVQDQDGGYDDWIELYNNTDQDINLEGYYISDKPDNPTKWTFPAAVIPAKGYIIVWADEEQEQDGLHSNFKLSASGESIILSDKNGVVLDEITFPALGEDVAYGRYPNGTGDFKELPATFNKENSDGSAAVKPLDQASFRVYPSPFESTLYISGARPVRQVRIYDISGRVVCTDLSGSNIVTLPALPNGFYFIQINGSEVIRLTRINQ